MKQHDINAAMDLMQVVAVWLQLFDVFEAAECRRWHRQHRYAVAAEALW